MEIKTGMKFLCIKPVYMTGGGVREYSKGKIYTSNEDGCITSNSGNHFHSWDVVEKDEYFKPLDQVRYVHTEATPEVENLFENYPGKREGERNNMEAVIYFSNISVEEQDTAFTAHTYKYPKDITEISDYMIPSSFIEFMGLETVKQEEGKDLDYRWSYVGRDILGFKFNQDDYPDVGWNDAMESNLYKSGVIEEYNEYNNSFSVRFEDLKAWDYPADMVVDQLERKDALVELSNSESYDSEQEVFNPKSYYDNSKGSLYKVATERGWNAYLFDLVKRLERGGKKDPLRQEIEKSIDVLKIWLNELPEQSN